MNRLIILKIALFVYALTLTTSIRATHTEEFTNIYTFGDSFTYQGTWSDFLMQHYDIKYVNGENGFAVGGGNTAGLQAQLSNYNNAAKGYYDRNALYLVFMGPSDAANSYNGDLIDPVSPDHWEDSYQILFWHIEMLANRIATGPDTSKVDLDDLQKKIETGQINLNALLDVTINDIDKRASLLKNFIKTISDNGAHYIVVLNNFNNELRWEANRSDLGMYMGKIWVDIWNKAIYSKLKELPPSVNIIFVDHDRLINEVTDDPLKYFTAAEIVGTQMNAGYFDSGAHGTIAANKLLSEYVASVIESPSRVAMVRELAIQQGARLFRDVENVSMNLSDGNVTNSFTTEIKADYTSTWTKPLTNKNLGFKNSTDYSGTALINTKISDRALIGILLDRHTDDISFIKNYGKARVKEVAVASHTAYSFSDSLFSYIAFGVGDLHYSITRNIKLGIGENTEHGKTRGMHYLAMIGTGYKYAINSSMTVTPHVTLNYQQVSMKKYQEKGNIRSTNMSFDIPNRTSMKAECAVELESNYNLTEKIPSTAKIVLSYGYDFLDPIKKPANALVSDMPRWFSVPTYKVPVSSFDLRANLLFKPKPNLTFGLNGSASPLGMLKNWSIGFSINKHL